MAEPQVLVPFAVRLTLARAAVQTIADEVGADLLHIKGNAVDPALRPTVRPGSDVDVLIRPLHIDRFDQRLRTLGWSIYSTFPLGSPFGHAQTYEHPVWGYLDLHRLFPGIELDPDDAFGLLWADRAERSFGQVSATVPSLTAQSLILLLNCARTPVPDDLQRLWTDASSQARSEVSRLALTLHAEVALAAATGDLERMRGRRTYPLWNVTVNGGTRAQEWWARVRAAPTIRDAAIIVWRAPLVNTEALSHRLGRAPTRAEVVREFFARPLTALRELRRRRA
jgi:hypothetical protein